MIFQHANEAEGEQLPLFHCLCTKHTSCHCFQCFLVIYVTQRHEEFMTFWLEWVFLITTFIVYVISLCFRNCHCNSYHFKTCDLYRYDVRAAIRVNTCYSSTCHVMLLFTITHGESHHFKTTQQYPLTLAICYHTNMKVKFNCSSSYHLSIWFISCHRYHISVFPSNMCHCQY